VKQDTCLCVVTFAGHLGAGDQRLGGPHRRLVSALGLADRVDLLVGLDRSDLADPVVGVDGDLDPALAERVRGADRAARRHRHGLDALVANEPGVHVVAGLAAAVLVVVVGVALDGVGGRLLAGATVLQSADENVDLAVGVQREERVGAGEPGEIQLVGVVLRGVDQVPVRVEIGEPVVESRAVHTAPARPTPNPLSSRKLRGRLSVSSPAK